MCKTYLLLFFLLPFWLSGQSRKIKGTLYTKDSVCVGEGKKHKVKLKKCKNIAVLLSRDLYMSSKYLINTNRRGVFRIKLSKEDLEYYKFLVFAGDSIQTSFISLDATKRKISLEMEKERTAEDYFVGKPAIYLYPQSKLHVSIKLNFKGKIGTTFPDYKNGWNVEANPNGELLNLDDNRKYNYLFWDGTYGFDKKHFAYPDGFVVKKENLASFLISKLSQIGLNNTEINDFVVYWLPMLSKNNYNLIHFWINDNIDNTAFLDINPKPETLIRVFVEFKKVENDYKIKEQILPSFARKGFTVVEWGGSNINNTTIEYK